MAKIVYTIIENYQKEIKTFDTNQTPEDSEDKQFGILISGGYKPIVVAETVAQGPSGSNPASVIITNDEDMGSLKCQGRCIKGVSWGYAMHEGRRTKMEDSLAIVPAFMRLSCDEVGGCTAPGCKYEAEKQPVHYFGLFDGHGGAQVSGYCARELHEMVADEWEREGAGDRWSRRWEVALSRACERADEALKDKALAPHTAGSTASVVVLSSCQIIAANCGDSRAVLCRGTQAIPLTIDHKLDREDEVVRITQAGGKLLYWDCLRVEGVLSMTRAIGDQYLKPWIISVPEVTFMTRSEEDECLVLASDGLWNAMSNEEVIKLARGMLRRQRKLALKNDSKVPPAENVAVEVLNEALCKSSSDNISVIVIDLKLPRRRSQQKQ